MMTYLCWISQHIFMTLFFENYKDMNNAHYLLVQFTIPELLASLRKIMMMK